MNLLKDFWAMIFPDFCVACQQSLVKGEFQICTNCQFELPQTDFHQNSENDLVKKFGGKIPLKYGLAYWKFTKNGRVQQILHALKYQGNQEVGILAGKWYGYVLTENSYNQEFDIILPVPLHISRLRKRGYNQSDCFAQGLSETLQVPWSSQVIIRTKATETQTKKSQLERWKNVAEIFEIKNKDLIQGKKVLLVDDVVTTGATLESCLKIILAAGASELSIATIAIAQY